METSQRLQIGDQVRTRGYVVGLPPGSMGTIEVALPFGDLYDVKFDDLTEPHILQRRALEIIQPTECEVRKQVDQPTRPLQRS